MGSQRQFKFSSVSGSIMSSSCVLFALLCCVITLTVGENILKDGTCAASTERLMNIINELETKMNKMESQIKDSTRGFPEPDFESNWFIMKSQDTILSYAQIFHEFNAVP